MGLQGDLDNKSPFSTRVFRLLLNILIPNVAEKKILILVEEK
jgi:hypothetical protein